MAAPGAALVFVRCTRNWPRSQERSIGRASRQKIWPPRQRGYCGRLTIRNSSELHQDSFSTIALYDVESAVDSMSWSVHQHSLRDRDARPVVRFEEATRVSDAGVSGRALTGVETIGEAAVVRSEHGRIR
jgi:hypothetical protein